MKGDNVNPFRTADVSRDGGFITAILAVLLTSVVVGAALAVSAATSVWVFTKVCDAITCL